jgi:hypothetical protein
VTFTLSLWLLMTLMWTKLVEQLQNIKKQVSTARSTSCRSEDDQKSMDSTLDESQLWQWSEAGATPPDYTSTSSVTPGVHDKKEYFNNDDPDPYLSALLKRKK